MLAVIVGAVGVQRALDRHPDPVLVTNGIGPGAFAVEIPSHARACESSVPPPPGARAVQLTVGTYGRPGVRVRTEIPAGGRGRSTPIVREGVVDVPIPNRGGGRRDRLCLINEGPSRIAVGGAVVGRRDGATVGGRRRPGLFSVTYVRPVTETWRDRAPRIIDRVGYAKGFVGGSATGPIVIVVVVAAVGAALAACWRWLRA